MVLICPACSKPLDGRSDATDTDNPRLVSCPYCGFQSSLTDDTEQTASLPRDSEAAATGDTIAGDEQMDGGGQRGASGSDTAPIIRRPSSIAHFRLIRPLGKGAFGEVWLAEDTRLVRMVALKLPHPTEQDSRLLHEAKTAAQLSHPHIVSVYEVGEHDGQPFIASEYIEGRTLQEELQQGRPTVSRALEVIRILAEAAHYAHEAGVIHRDLKPSNVIVDSSGDPHVTDFGIAKSMADDVTAVGAESMMGTVAYMAPEQAAGQEQPVDRRADIYALGVMLFELLTEYRPFRGNAEGVLHQKTERDAPSPRTLVPSISRDLETVCLKCLERDPANRYRSAREVASEMAKLQQNLPVQARPVSRTEKLWRLSRRNPLVSGLTAALVLVVLLGVFWSFRFAFAVQRESAAKDLTLYRARMNLVADSYDDGDIERMRQLLDYYRNPTSAETDLRDYAWSQFNRLSDGFHQVVHHGRRVDHVAIAPDGSVFATAGPGGQIRVWDCESGAEVRSISVDGRECNALEFAASDNRLLAGYDDGVIRVWSPTQHGRLTFDLAHGGRVTALAVSPDGRGMVSGSESGDVKLWLLPSRELINEALFRSSALDGRSIDLLEYSPDGRYLAVLYSDPTAIPQRAWRHLAIINVDTGSVTSTSKQRQQINGLTWSADGQRVLASQRNGILQEIEPENGSVRVLRNQAGQSGEIATVLDEGQTRVLLTEFTGKLKVLNAEMSTVNEIVSHRPPFGVLDVNQAAGLVIVGSVDGIARLMTVDALLEPTVGQRSAAVRDVCFAADGKSVAVAEVDGSVTVWDPQSGSFSELIPVPMPAKPVISLAANPIDGTVACCGLMRELRIAEFESGRLTGEVQLPAGGHSSVSISPDGKLIASGGSFGTVSVFRSSVLSDRVAFYERPDTSVVDVAFTPNSDMLAAAYADGHIALISTADGSASQWDADPVQLPVCISFSPDGRQLAVGTQTGMIQVVAYPSGRTLRKTRSHAGQVNSLKWFPDGKLMASGGEDTEVKIWDAESGELVTRLVGHRRQVLAVDVSSDGKSVVSSSSDGNVRLWRSGDRR
jgi:WD40 repeat protein/predicted Ser/Thr protein kinase/DNA-directed RNA polymerase subunit RPC12/RpoP